MITIFDEMEKFDTMRAMSSMYQTAIESDCPQDWKELHRLALLVYEARDYTLKNEARFILKLVERMRRLREREFSVREKTRELNRAIQQYNEKIGR